MSAFIQSAAFWYLSVLACLRVRDSDPEAPSQALVLAMIAIAVAIWRMGEGKR
jgi:hypothetical protein